MYAPSLIRSPPDGGSFINTGYLTVCRFNADTIRCLERRRNRRQFCKHPVLNANQQGEDKMDFFILYLMMGAFIGWVTNQIIGSSRQQSLLFNVVVGVVGVFITGLFLAPLLGMAAISEATFSLPALLVSLGGSVILLAVVNLFRRGGLNTR